MRDDGRRGPGRGGPVLDPRPDPKGKVRFYLDGAEAPAIEAPMYDC